MLVSQERLLGPVRRSRWFEVLAGLIIGGVGALFLLATLAAVVVSVFRPGDPLPVFATASLTVIGAVCLVVGWRLVSGRMREGHQGLLEPTGLRVAGICCAFATLVPLLDDGAWLVERISLSVSLAIACFALAHRRAKALRERQAAVEEAAVEAAEEWPE